MADYNLEAKITADASGYEAGVKKAEKASKNLSTSVSKVIQGLGKNGLVGALGAVGLASSGLSATLGSVVKIARKVSQTINECTEAYKSQLIAERALETAVQNNPFVTGETTKALKDFASQMQKVSNYGDEELIPMMTNLVSLGRTEAETMQIMAVAMDMSAGMGISLDTAITQLNATLNGNIGRLGQQNAELKNLTEEELKQGKAIEILGEKFKGLSSATADTSKQLKNIKGDFKEALGEFTLPSSDLWNKFWTGFYERGIEVIKKINSYLDAQTVGKTLAKNLEEQLSNLGYTGDRIAYMRDAFSVISDSELNALDDYLSGLRNVNESQKQLLERVQLEKQRRIDIAEIEKQMAEESAKRKKALEEEAELENGIAKLKQTHLQKIAEQEAKWEHIKQVTGEEVSLQEKLKFYQDDLVAIMSEAGGQITTNNQYYKDQMAIIEKLIALIKGNAEVVSTSYFSIFGDTFKALTEYVDEVEKELNDKVAKIKKIAETIQKTFSKAFKKLGEEIAQGGVSWKSYAKIALEAIAEVLEAIAKELTAIAVIKIMAEDYAKAGIALAGATTALIGAGALTATASNLDKVTQSAKETSEAIQECTTSFESMQEAVENIAQGFTKTPATLFSTQADYRKLIAEQTEIVEEAWNKYFDVSFETASIAFKIQDIEGQIRKILNQTSLGTYQIAMAVLPLQMELNKLTKQYKELEAIETAYGEDYREKAKVLKEAQEALAKTTQDVINNFKKQSDAMIATARAYKELYSNTSIYSEMVGYEQRAGTNKLLGDYWSTLANTGKTIGETFIKSIVNGASEADFASSMKTYLREQMIKLSVYTEEMAETFAQWGTQLSSAIITGDKSTIQTAKANLTALYKDAIKQAKEVESVLDEIFGNVAESVEETISDMGTSIADTLVNSLSEGLDQSSFLDSVKKWIRKLLIQTVVYTESMKAEIEAIGQSISKALSEGFTETTFHEIRRDLSWVFNEANNTMSNLDNILNNVFGGYATGTDNATRGLHLVGEAGPELVRFKGGEQVLNAGNTQKALSGVGGNSNVFNVNFTNVKDTSAYALVSQFKQYNRQMAINGIL